MTITLWLNCRELAMLRSKHPSLLDQANGYGGQAFADGAKLPNLPEAVAAAVNAALDAWYGPEDRQPV